MSQTAQNKNDNAGVGFTTFQAYTLAVITLAIGIAVGYFARGSASPNSGPEAAQAAVPAGTAPSGMGAAPAQLPGIGSTQQQQAPSPEMLAKAAEPLLNQLKNNPNDVDTVVKVSKSLLRQSGLSAGYRILREGIDPPAQQCRCADGCRNRILVHRGS